jgi:hypothetical protein
MSDPYSKLESQPVDAASKSTSTSTPASTSGAGKTAGTGAAANDIPPGDPNYPKYLLNIIDGNGASHSHINGPHTSASIALGGAATTTARLRVEHIATSVGPNLKVIVERG